MPLSKAGILQFIPDNATIPVCYHQPLSWRMQCCANAKGTRGFNAIITFVLIWFLLLFIFFWDIFLFFGKASFLYIFQRLSETLAQYCTYGTFLASCRWYCLIYIAWTPRWVESNTWNTTLVSSLTGTVKYTQNEFGPLLTSYIQSIFQHNRQQMYL